VSNTAPFGLSSFALSLLLVFRTNSSYARWDEARKIWGAVTNRSRDLVRQAESWMAVADDDLLDMVNRWMIALPRSMMVHLREDGDLEAELKDILTEPELRALLAAQHRPNYVMSVISTAIEEAQVPDAARVRMDENVTSFADDVGKCERILKTPIPLTYTRHTSRFLVIWLTFMPFTLWHAYGWGSIPASAAISFLLLGIEEIGVQIEEPFSILPLEAMCATIQGNLVEMHQKRLEVRSLVLSKGTEGSNGSNGASDPRPAHERRQESSRPLFRSPEQLSR
jgi:predicted membrane chloride channel (bestrophin family)